MVSEYKRSAFAVSTSNGVDSSKRICPLSASTYIPTPVVDAQVVADFFEALSPVELDALKRALAAQQENLDRIDIAHKQQLQRLRYETQLAERQFRRVDPDNRLVAAELEGRWEEALRALKQAEDTITQRRQQVEKPLPLPDELKAAFTNIGEHLPQLWKQFSREQQKALLRCLIDKIVVHRLKRDTLQLRIVWRGGDTTSRQIPIPVNSFAELSGAQEMERIIIDHSQKGQSDEAIAAHLTELGHCSPQCLKVLPSTVKTIRLKHGIFQVRHQSHPRRIPGYLTVPQIARMIDKKAHFLYHLINTYRIKVKKDTKTGLYLFPDRPETLEMFRKLKTGDVDNLCIRI